MYSNTQFLHLVSGKFILAAVPVVAGTDEAVHAAVDKVAVKNCIGYWIKETGEGDVIKHIEADTADLNAGSASRAYEVIVRSGVPFEAKEYEELVTSERLERFWITVVDAEQAYNLELSKFRVAVAEWSPQDGGAIDRLQDLFKRVLMSADHAAKAHPAVVIDPRTEVKEVLKETAWILNGDNIASRVEEISIGASTDVYVSESRDVMRFLFRVSAGAHGWNDAFAYVYKNNGSWRVAREQPWLQERKRQLQVNDAQIEYIHNLLEKTGIKGE